RSTLIGRLLVPLQKFLEPDMEWDSYSRHLTDSFFSTSISVSPRRVGLNWRRLSLLRSQPRPLKFRYRGKASIYSDAARSLNMHARTSHSVLNSIAMTGSR